MTIGLPVPFEQWWTNVRQDLTLTTSGIIYSHVNTWRTKLGTWCHHFSVEWMSPWVRYAPPYSSRIQHFFWRRRLSSLLLLSMLLLLLQTLAPSTLLASLAFTVYLLLPFWVVLSPLSLKSFPTSPYSTRVHCFLLFSSFHCTAQIFLLIIIFMSYKFLPGSSPSLSHLEATSL